MQKQSTYTTMQLIADILNFQDNRDLLSEHIQHSKISWDRVVIIASHHLMLPAVYCKLKEKKLLHLLPEELTIYLEEIAALNRSRNNVLLNEIHEISKIFNNEKIEHVFIKGAALLAGNTFKDGAERMIGDIDILVALNQLDKAFEILTKCGYNKTIESNYKQKSFRHLPRQISGEKYGAVELHSEVLIPSQRHLLIKEQILKKKRIINGIPVPAAEDSIIISILALQINDKAHLLGFIQLKTIYDCLALEVGQNTSLLNELSSKKHSRSFLSIASLFFKELHPMKSSFYSKYIRRHFLFRLEYPKLGYFTYGSVNVTENCLIRLKLFTYNPHYRTHILKNKIFSINRTNFREA